MSFLNTNVIFAFLDLGESIMYLDIKELLMVLTTTKIHSNNTFYVTTNPKRGPDL